MVIITTVYQKLNLGALYFMDNWPATPYRQMVIVDPVSWDQKLQPSLGSDRSLSTPSAQS
jgi:hypothetical protein